MVLRFAGFSLIMIFAAQPHSRVFGQTIIIREVDIGAPGVPYVDPEFDDDGFQVVFYQGITRISLGQIDRKSGHFVDHNYKFIDVGAPIFLCFNGPEWGYSQHGAGIYYTKIDPHRRLHTFRYRDGTITQLDRGNFGLVGNYPSKNRDDPATYVMGAYLPPSLPLGTVWDVFSEDASSKTQQFGMHTVGKGPRFVPNKKQVTTNMLDQNGVEQLALYDLETNQTTQSTFDADDKDGGEIVLAPELGGEPLYIGVVNSGAAIRAYRNQGNAWRPYAEIPINSNFAANVQTFTYGGKTYCSFNRPSKTVRRSNDVVIASLDGKTNLTVSNPEVAMKRCDPETLVSGNHLFVYYWDYDTRKLYLSDVTIE